MTDRVWIASRRQWIALLWSSAVGAGCFAVVVGTIHIDRIDPLVGWANLLSLRFYALAFIAMWLLLSAVAWKLLLGHEVSRYATGRQYGSALVIVAVAAAVRLVAVFAGPPQLSDDLWRYIHDGRRLAAGFNPYGQTPASLGAGASGDRILDQINHPELVTIYQPASQVVFAMLWWLHPDEVDPLAVHTFRLGFAGFDLVIVGLLLVQLRRQRRCLWWAILYAWHPLAISEVAASGHQDVIGVAMLLATLVGARSNDVSRVRALGVGIAFAAAVAVKPIVMPLALPLAWAMRHHPRWIATAAASAIATGLLLYLPFIILDGGIPGLFDTVLTFAGRWYFNGSLHPLAVAITGSTALAGVCMIGLLMVVLCVSTWFQDDPWKTIVLFFLVSLLFSSTVYPWYLLWALVLVPIRFDLAVWVFSATIPWSYVVLADMARWQVPLWVLIAEYSLVYGAIALNLWPRLRGALGGVRNDV